MGAIRIVWANVWALLAETAEMGEGEEAAAAVNTALPAAAHANRLTGGGSGLV